MAEYINREDAYYAAGLIALSSVDRKITCGEVQRIMNSIPNADVVERKRGKWIHFSRSDECSVCGYDTGKYEAPTWFCPKCGADMRGET